MTSPQRGLEIGSADSCSTSDQGRKPGICPPTENLAAAPVGREVLRRVAKKRCDGSPNRDTAGVQRASESIPRGFDLFVVHDDTHLPTMEIE